MKRMPLLSLLFVLGLASCDPVVGQSSSSSAPFSLEESSFGSPAASEDTSLSDGHSSLESMSVSQTSSNWPHLSSSRSEKESQSFSQAAPSSVSSTDSSSDSLDDNEYCSVSLYQSYPEYNLGHMKGEIRFDKTIKVECGQPLYSTVDERHAFEGRLDEDYYPHGGTWFTHYLFVDPECTTYYLSGTPILEDSSFYYYCEG